MQKQNAFMVYILLETVLKEFKDYLFLLKTFLSIEL